MVEHSILALEIVQVFVTMDVIDAINLKIVPTSK